MAVAFPLSPQSTPFPLSGTLPVRPIHPSGFVGTIEQDGQVVNVTAIAFNAEKKNVVFMSLVGRDTSVSAVLAQIWKKEEAVFRHSEHVRWEHEEQFFRRLEAEKYKQIAAKLPEHKLVHMLALPHSANIAEGILAAPSMEKHPHLKEVRVPALTPRYVLGNLQEETPHALSFLGQLRAMRVVLLYRDEAHPERFMTWASELWQRGVTRKLIEPLPALGVRVWKIQADVYQWNVLVAQGTQEGWLPW